MIRRVVFAEQARRDLTDIFDFLLVRFGERSASSALDALYEHCLGFDLFPRRGRNRDDLLPGLRVVGYQKQATIAFLVQEKTVTILRIFPAGREIRFDPGAF